MNLAMRNLFIVLFISILVAISGCSSLSEITKLEGEGKKNIYQKNIDAIWPIVILSINDLYILAYLGFSLFINSLKSFEKGIKLAGDLLKLLGEK